MIEEIVTRDGKHLPVDETLHHARQIIEHDAMTHIERGLALALEAALLALRGAV